MTEEEKKNLKNKILEQVKAGKVKMRPRSYFVWRGVLLALLLITVVLFALFIVSFIVFSIRTSGLGYLSAFGVRGFMPFLGGLPWLLVLVAIALVVILEILVKQYSFAYKKPLLYSVVGVLVFVVAVGAFAGNAPFHEKFLERAHERRLPLAGGLYRGIGEKLPRNVYTGEVIEVVEDGFVLLTRDGKSLDITVTSETRMPHGQTLLKGQEVFVAGEMDGKTIKAFGVRRLSPMQMRLHRSEMKGSHQ